MRLNASLAPTLPPHGHLGLFAQYGALGIAVLASAATVIAALCCLTIAKVNGTSGMGPIAAMGVACAALSMLTLLPALLTICGRRAFWPFVPHSTEWMAREGVTAGRFRRQIVEAEYDRGPTRPSHSPVRLDLRPMGVGGRVE